MTVRHHPGQWAFNRTTPYHDNDASHVSIVRTTTIKRIPSIYHTGVFGHSMHYAASHISLFPFPYTGGTLFLPFWNRVFFYDLTFILFRYLGPPLLIMTHSILMSFFWISCHDLTPGLPSPRSSFPLAYKRI